LYLLWCN